VVAGLVTGSSIVVPDKMLAGAGVAVVRDEVSSVDRAERMVTTVSGATFSYDKLYLATGASPFVPPIEGHDLHGVVTLRGLPDAEKIRELIGTATPKRIVCIGAGFISMEVASLLVALHGSRCDVTVVELLDRPLPLMLDGDMAAEVRDYLEEKGIRLLTGEKVARLVGRDGRVGGAALASGTVLDADIVFMNVGVRPNTALAESIGLEMGRFGIKVNGYQETSDPDILAGGDCVEKINVITGKPTPGQLRGPAVVQGRLAAKRLAGYDIAFPGVVDAGGCKMFDMTIAATGLTEERAVQEGIATVSGVVESRSKHAMIPGVRPWKIKLVFNRENQRLIGGQIVAYDVAPAREIDAVSAFILGGKTIRDLTTFTSACNPDISSEPSAEPITIAAEQALQKVGKTH
jgi:NADPH-dependent 2,4-dienoyl-CoA reductase/sulfur reductase-like enzyme